MGKRIRFDEPSDDAFRSTKKSRHNVIKNEAVAEEIVTARQLQSVLTFEQDQAQLLRCKTIARRYDILLTFD
jgi:hypothetical protein